MIRIVVGLPGPATAWCAETLVSLARMSGRTAAICGLRALNDVAPAALRLVEDDLVCVAHTLDAELAAALRGLDRPLFVVSGDPGAAMGRLVASGVEPTQAFRTVLSCCAGVTAAADAPGAEIVAERDCRRDPAGVAERMAALCGYAIPAEASIPALEEDPPTGRADLPGAVERGMRKVLDCFPEGRLAADVSAIRIDAALFHQGAAPFAPVDGPIDVTGYSRILFFGPYVSIPPGDWEVRLVLSFEGAAGEGRFHADVVQMVDREFTVLAYATFSAAAGGEQVVSLPFKIASPDGFVEFRLQSTHAVFDGELTLHGASVTSRAPRAVAANPGRLIR